MRIDGLNITENRAYWLSLLVVNRRNWVRRDCKTFNTCGNRRMPEPVYMWLVENYLIDVDGESISVSEKGERTLKAWLAK